MKWPKRFQWSICAAAMLMLLLCEPHVVKAQTLRKEEPLELEATVKTEGAFQIACGHQKGLWAISGIWETRVFKGKTQKAKFRWADINPAMRFVANDQALRFAETRIDLHHKTHSIMPRVWDKYGGGNIANAEFPDDSVAIAFVTYRAPKGKPQSSRTKHASELLVLNSINGTRIHTLHDNLGTTEHLDLALHGDWVAIAHDSLKVWNWRTGEAVYALELAEKGSRPKIAFSADGKWLATLDPYSGTMTLWDTEKWAVWHEWVAVEEAAEGIVQIAFDPAGGRLFVANKITGLTAYDITREALPKKSAISIPTPVKGFAISPDGAHLYIAGEGVTQIYRLHR